MSTPEYPSEEYIQLPTEDTEVPYVVDTSGTPAFATPIECPHNVQAALFIVSKARARMASQRSYNNYRMTQSMHSSSSPTAEEHVVMVDEDGFVQISR